MAVAAKPEIARILLDLGIEPVDVYAVDNAEKTYLSALIEGISTLEFANKGDSTRSRILRDEVKRVRDKKRKKVNVGKLIGKKTILPASKIKPQALLPAAEEKKSPLSGIKSAVDGILNVLKLGNKLDKKDAADNRRERQRQRRKKREGMLEGLGKGVKGAAKAGNKVVSALVSPFQGIFSAITTFLKFTLLGILFNKGLAWFSDEENQKKIANFGRFLKDWWPSLLAGFALFFTPIGSLVSGVVNLLIWAIPALTRLLAANPWLSGLAIFSMGALLPKFFPGLVKDKSDAAVEESTKEIGKENTLEKLKNEKSGNFFDRLMGERKERQEKISNLEEDDGSETRYGFFGPLPRRSDPNAFDGGGQVLGPSGKDIIPAYLSNEEFVVSAPAVKEFGPGIFALMNAMGGGTNQPTVKDGTVLAEGGGLVDIGNMYGHDNWMKPWQSDGGSSQWLPAKSKGMVAVPPRVRPKSPEVIELPTKVTDLRKSKKVISGTTIPQFKITTDSPMRTLIKVNLGLED